MTRLPLPNPDLLAMSRRLSPFPIFYFLLVRKSRIISFFRSPGSLPFDTSLLILAQGADVVRLVEIGMVEVPKSVENFSSSAGFHVRRLRVQSTLEYLYMYVSDVVVKSTGGHTHHT